MKKIKFLSAILLTLAIFAPYLMPISLAMKPATSSTSPKCSLPSDSAIENYVNFLREFKALAASCDYDPYFDYEAEEARIMMCGQLNIQEVTKLSGAEKKVYLEKAHAASVKIVMDQHHGLGCHFSDCVVDLCKRYNIDFRILTTRGGEHSAVAYKIGDNWYVADMFLQVAYLKAPNRRFLAQTCKDDPVLSSMLGCIDGARSYDPIAESVGSKGIEYASVPIENYLKTVAVPGRANIFYDEDWIVKFVVYTPIRSI
ncbi:MAG: hypothetical protein Q4D57_03620 [Clostridia bacterium]|nr:hypothetical protein [Clostridia bacterium]